MLSGASSPRVSRTPPGKKLDFDENSNPNSAGNPRATGSAQKQPPRESVGSNWFRNYTLDSDTTLSQPTLNESNGNVLQEATVTGGGLNMIRPRGRSSASSAGMLKTHLSRSGKKKGRKSLAFSEFGQFSEDSGTDEDTMHGQRGMSEATSGYGGDMLADFEMAIKVAPGSQSQSQHQEDQPSMSQPTQSNRNFAPDSPDLPIRTSFAPRMSEFAPPVFGSSQSNLSSQPFTIHEEEEEKEQQPSTTTTTAAAAPTARSATLPTTTAAAAPTARSATLPSVTSPADSNASDPVKLLLGKLQERDGSADRFMSLPDSVCSLPESSHPANPTLKSTINEVSSISAASSNVGHIHFNISNSSIDPLEPPKPMEVAPKIAEEPDKISLSFQPFKSLTAETDDEQTGNQPSVPVASMSQQQPQPQSSSVLQQTIITPSPSPETRIPGRTPPRAPSVPVVQATPLDRPVVAAPTPATVLDPPMKKGPTLQPSTLQKEQEKLQAQKRKSVAGRKSSVRPSFGHGGVPVNTTAEQGEMPDIIAELLGPDPFEDLRAIESAPTEADPTPNRHNDLNIFTQTQDSIPEEPSQTQKSELFFEPAQTQKSDAFFDCQEEAMDTSMDTSLQDSKLFDISASTINEDKSGVFASLREDKKMSGPPAENGKKEFPDHIKSLLSGDDSPEQPTTSPLISLSQPAPGSLFSQPTTSPLISLSQPAPGSLFSQSDIAPPPLTQPGPRYSVADSMSMASSNPRQSTTPTQHNKSQIDTKPVPSPFLDNRHMSITSEDLQFEEDKENRRQRKLELQPSEKQKMAEANVEVVCAGRQSIATPLIPLQPNSTVPTPKRDAQKKQDRSSAGPSEARSLSQDMSSQLSLQDTLSQTPMGMSGTDDFDYARMPARQLTPIPEGENENTISERSSAVSEIPAMMLSMRETLSQPSPGQPQSQHETPSKNLKESRDLLAQGTPKDSKRVSKADTDSPTENWLGRPSAGPSNFPSLAELMERKPENEMWNSPSEESAKKDSRVIVEMTPGKKIVARARTPRSSTRKSKTSTTISFHITSPAPQRHSSRTAGPTNGTFNLSVTSGETNPSGFTLDSGLGSQQDHGIKRSTSRLRGREDDDDHSSEIAAALMGGPNSSQLHEDTDMSMALGQTTMFGGMRPMNEDTDMSIVRKSMHMREGTDMSIAGATLTQMGGLFNSSNIAANAAAAAVARDQQQPKESKGNFQQKADRRKTMDFFGRSKKKEESAPDPSLLDDTNIDTDDEKENNGFKDYETPQQRSAMPIQNLNSQLDGFSDSDSSSNDSPPMHNHPIPVMAPISNETGKEPAFMQEQKEGTTPLMEKSDDSFTLITKAREANNTVTQMGARGSPLSVPPGSPRGNTVAGFGIQELEDSIHNAVDYLKQPEVKRHGERRPSGMSPNAKRAKHDGSNVAELIRNSPRKGPASFGNMTAQMERPKPNTKQRSPNKPPGEVPYVPSNIAEFGAPGRTAPSRPSFADRIAEAGPVRHQPQGAHSRNVTPDFNAAPVAQRSYSPRAMPEVLSPWAADGYQQPNYQSRVRPNVMSSPMPSRNVAMDSATPRLQLTSPKRPQSARHMDLNTPAKFPGLEMPTPHKYHKHMSVDIPGIPSFDSTRAMLQPLGWYFEGLPPTEQRNTPVADTTQAVVKMTCITPQNRVKYRSQKRYTRVYSTMTELYLMWPMENQVIMQVQYDAGNPEPLALCRIKLKKDIFSNVGWQDEFFEHWKQITLCDFTKAFNTNPTWPKIPLSKNALAIEWFNESMQDLEFLQWEMHRLDTHWPQGVNYDMLPFGERRPGETGMMVEVQLYPPPEYRTVAYIRSIHPKNPLPPCFRWRATCRKRHWHVELIPCDVAGSSPCRDHNIDLIRAQDKANEVLRHSPLRQPALYDSLYAAIADIRIQYGAYRLAPFGPWVSRINL